MSVKERLFSNMFIRNMISDLFGRSGNYQTPGIFSPYFQYKIGSYQSDHFLYFQKEPFGLRYYNEFFNKLNEYIPGHIPDYLEFHFSAYTDKQGFLRFMQHEISGRLKLNNSKARFQKLEIAQAWVLEKQQELKSIQKAAVQQEIKQGVQDMLPAASMANPEEIESIAQNLSQKINDRIEEILTGTEERMLAITDSFVTGNIELNNQNHLNKVVKLFKLLKNVQAPTEKARAEQLFRRFSDTDIAAILRLHFEPFKSKQHNSIQKTDIKKADEIIPDKNPNVLKLEAALQEYFYS
ncbi:hypothetical protein A4H97_33795 [Niastella yeongjuensis]|uniref:Uncharacterized protein n=1 Tax=Niastella yeongjuensis TaxID=354355 RepID=A0A1V9ECC9_9BACT|nr:hypothetical protein [Niastella yeongjuensis]OQP43624.1 hypothetical protein A4H97_33795 [Niastella yeongjuensis]SEP49300.1 hypothetical protein SAMN05660816_06943 [Niastella yeongjuensis]